MTLPDNLSLRGLGTWAEGAGNPPANNQHINADTVDNRHYLDMKNEWQSYTDNNAGSSIRAYGTANFAGAGTVGVYIPAPAMSNTDYRVVITPRMTDYTDSHVGEWGVGTKYLNHFNVVNSGTGTGQFDWFVMEV